LTIILAATAVAAVAAVGAAAVSAATATVTISSAGFSPTNVSVNAGDTVRWVNSDTAVHQVVLANTTGVQCAQPLVIQPAQSASCVFTKAGKYDYSDPTVRKGNKFKGRVDVAAAPASLSFAAAPRKVVYGGSTTLNGNLSTQEVGQNVDVLGQPCGASTPVKLATLATTTGGAFSFVAKPTVGTKYGARYKSVDSPTTQVNVAPKVRLVRLAVGKYSARVTAAQSFKGRYVALQRYNTTTARWIFVRSIALRVATPGVAPNVTTSSSFTIRRGLRLRLTMAKAQVGACYVAGVSNTATS
jgi:plastocyanin